MFPVGKLQLAVATERRLFRIFDKTGRLSQEIPADDRFQTLSGFVLKRGSMTVAEFENADIGGWCEVDQRAQVHP